MKKYIPNTLTCLNAVAGTTAILLIMQGALLPAVWCVVIALVLDFLDGMMARLLHVKSELGKELDSLSDAISFGVVPALFAHVLLRDAVGPGAEGWLSWLPFLPVMIPAFSVLRLALFNLDTRQAISFIGLPTPANALFWTSLVVASQLTPEVYAHYWGHAWLLAFCVPLLSLLLVSEIPMFSLKISGFSWKNNRIRYLYLGMLILLAGVFQWGMITFVIPLYIVVSLTGMLQGGMIKTRA